MHRMLRLAAGALLGALLAGALAPAVAQEPWRALRALSRVALEISLVPDHPLVSVEDLERRVEEALRQGQPAPMPDPKSPDRLHVTISVRSYNASELRGFYLPFSGNYGIGAVRLAVERPAVVRGLAAPVTAVVWQSERQAKASWDRSGREILALVDELVGLFLEDYARAVSP